MKEVMNPEFTPEVSQTFQHVFFNLCSEFRRSSDCFTGFTLNDTMMVQT